MTKQELIEEYENEYNIITNLVSELLDKYNRADDKCNIDDLTKLNFQTDKLLSQKYLIGRVIDDLENMED